MLQITSRQPTDGAAWSALAQIYVLQRAYGFENDPRLPENTRAAAAKAIALDSKLAEPHAVLGFYDYFWAHGLSRAAEQEFQRALAINPECAIAHSWYGSMLTYEGRFPEALRELDHAERLQPSSTAILASRALALGLNGRRPEAVALLRQAGGDAPLPSIQYNLGVLAMVPPHDVRLWLDENLRLSESLRPPAYTRLFRAAQQAFRQGGEQAMWRSIAYSHEEAILPSLIADAHLALGETDVAFETLSEAEEQGADNMGSLAMDPLFAPFHEDSRYINLLKKAGIPAS